MRASERIRGAVLVVALAACPAGEDVPAPQVGSLVPDHGPPGAVIAINGDYFCQRAHVDDEPLCDPAGEVHFGAAPGTTSQWTETLIMVEVPSAVTGPVPVTVIANGKVSRPVTFTVE